jgi:hypothetical protein
LKKFERATMTRIGRRQINTRQRCWQCFLPARQSRSAQISSKLNSVSTLQPPDPQGFFASGSEIRSTPRLSLRGPDLVSVRFFA